MKHQTLCRRELSQRPARTNGDAELRFRPGVQTNHPGIGNHRAVIGAKFRTGIEDFPTALLHHFRQLRAQRTISADASRHHQPFKAGLFQRAATLNHQRIHDRVFKRAGNIGAGLVVIAVAADGVRGKSLEARKAEIQPGAVGHRAREDKAPFGALGGHLRQHRAAGII